MSKKFKIFNIPSGILYECINIELIFKRKDFIEHVCLMYKVTSKYNENSILYIQMSKHNTVHLNE